MPNDYDVGPVFHDGTISLIRLGKLKSGGPVLVKTAHSADDNDLLLQECEALDEGWQLGTTEKERLDIAEDRTGIESLFDPRD